MNITLRLGAAAAVLIALAACTPKKVMLSETFVPGSPKVAKSSFKTVGGDKKNGLLSNYYIQVCDVNGGQSSNCKTTLILENVTDFQIHSATGL